MQTPTDQTREATSPQSPLGAWGAYWRCLLLVEIVLAIVFASCSVWLTLANPTDTPMITPEVRWVFTWYSIGYSARVLLGYMLIGAVLATTFWLLMTSWSFVRNRPLSRRIVRRGTLVFLALLLTYKLVALCVLNPQVIQGALLVPWSVEMIAIVDACVPKWSLVGARLLAASGTSLLLLWAGVKALGQMRRTARLATLIISSVALAAVAGLGLRLSYRPRPVDRPRDNRPNILILASDGLRQEHLQAYGYHRPTSPNIAALSRNAVRATGCYVPLARTLTSWTSMLTGTWPHTHGLRHTWPDKPKISLGVPTLCQELKKKGYETLVFSDWAGSDFGKVDYGFDVKEVTPEAWSLSVWIGQATCRAHPLLLAFGDHWLGYRMYPEMKGMPVSPNPGAVTKRAVKALQDLSVNRKPFFMIVFYSETHMPYATRYPYYRRFTREDYDGPHKLSVFMPDLRLVASGKLDPEKFFDVQQLRDLYDGAILSFDDQVGTVVNSLKQTKLWDDTIVIISSDHGEDLLETKHAYGHGQYFDGDDYDSRIPLIISDPALRNRGEREVTEMFSSIDLMPTLLERVGLEAPESCDGRSVLDLLEGRRESRGGKIYAETGVMMGGGVELKRDDLMLYPPLLDMFEIADMKTGLVGIKPEYRERLITARHRMVRDSQWKLTYIPLEVGAEYALYDTKTDPECRVDVTSRHPKVFKRLKKDLWQWMERDPLRHREGEHLVRNGHTSALPSIISSPDDDRSR